MPNGLSFAALDIESTSLNASYGRLLCCGFKFFHERQPRMVESFRKGNESKALDALVAIYNEIDVIITWYGKHFDIPFLDARLLHHDKKPLIKKMHVDLKDLHAYRCRTAGHKLDFVAKDLALKHQKYEVEAEAWQAATDGDRPSFNRIVKHCHKDVLMTEEVFGRLKHLLVHITR